MMAKLRKQVFQSQSGKKSQMMIIDLIIAYLIFALFLFYISDFVVNFMQPFSNNINFDINHRDSESLKNYFYKPTIFKNDINEFCNFSINKSLSAKSNYEIKSIIMPYYDSYFNSNELGIYLLRKGNSLIIDFNANQSLFFDIIIFTSNNVYFNNLTVNEYDYYNKTIFEKKVLLSIFSNSSNQKSSFEIIVNDTAFLFFNYYDYDNIFISNIPFKYDCGKERFSEKKILFNSIANFENKKILVDYSVEVWMK